MSQAETARAAIAAAAVTSVASLVPVPAVDDQVPAEGLLKPWAVVVESAGNDHDFLHFKVTAVVDAEAIDAADRLDDLVDALDSGLASNLAATYGFGDWAYESEPGSPLIAALPVQVFKT